MVTDAGKPEYFVSKDGSHQFVIGGTKPQSFVPTEDGFILRKVPTGSDDLLSLISGLGSTARRTAGAIESTRLPAAANPTPATLPADIAASFAGPAIQSGSNDGFTSSPASGNGLAQGAIVAAPVTNTNTSTITHTQTIDNRTINNYYSGGRNLDIIGSQQEQF